MKVFSSQLMKIVELFFGNDWMEYKVIYKTRITKYVKYENKKLNKTGGMKKWD